MWGDRHYIDMIEYLDFSRDIFIICMSIRGFDLNYNNKNDEFMRRKWINSLPMRN